VVELLRQCSGIQLPADHLRTLEEVEAFLHMRRVQLGIPEIGEAEIQRRMWQLRLEAFVAEDLLPN
jgi:hypothetical protein